MTPEGIILLPPVKEWAQSHPSFFFADGRVTATSLVDQLYEGVIALGAKAVETYVVEGWHVVAAGEDWFANARFPIPEDFVFQGLTPFPELGQSCVRPEAVVAMFARDIIVTSTSAEPIVYGVVSPDDPIHTVLAGKPSWRRVIAFRGVGAEA